MYKFNSPLTDAQIKALTQIISEAAAEGAEEFLRESQQETKENLGGNPSEITPSIYLCGTGAFGSIHMGDPSWIKSEISRIIYLALNEMGPGRPVLNEYEKLLPKVGDIDKLFNS